MPEIDILVKSYINEKSTSYLLPYETIVEEFFGYLSEKAYETEPNCTIRSLLELEYNRINFYIKEYLCIRLKKIRYFCKVEEMNMSPRELKFYNSYKELHVFTNRDNHSTTTRTEYVGCICLKPVNSIILDNEVINLKESYLYIVRLDDIYSELIKGTVALV